MTSGPRRAATLADREALLDLWVEAWTAAMPGIDFEARRPWFSARLDQHATEGSITLLSVSPEGELAGFVIVDPARRYLDQLAVRPVFQGRGLATTLVNEAKRRSPDQLGLHVNQDNRRAVRFYEREGFSIVSAGTNPRSGLPVWQMMWVGEGRA